MKLLSMRARLSVSILAGCILIAMFASAAPYTNDAHTLRLDHLDGTTLGSLQGTAGFANGLSSLNQCATLPLGGFIMYSPSMPSTSSGTIEIWVKPLQYPCSIMTYNWSYSTSQPSAGYVMHLTLNPDGTARWYGLAGGSLGLDGISVVPTNIWSHLAVTWGSGGTTIYVNGMEDAHTASNWSPGSGYLYLNSSWGKAAVGSVDELRISDIARSEAELRDHYLSNLTIYHQLQVTVDGSGTVSPTNGWYAEGTNLNLTATPDAGWLFTGWSGDLSGGYAASNTTLLIDSDKLVTASFSDDADCDGLLNTNEWAIGTDARNRDSDGDHFDDGFEVAHGYSPMVSDAAITDYIRTNGTNFDLYSSNAVLNVAIGEILAYITNSSVNLSLQLQQTSDLNGTWSNAGPHVEWSIPVDGEKQFFRVRVEP